MRAVLISTYELGHQPFGLASPAAWLRRAGAELTCCDLAVQPLDRQAVAGAAFVGVYVPMHTATRLAAELLPELRALAPAALIVCYGLYAPLNAELLRARGADACVGGEFEAELVGLYRGALDREIREGPSEKREREKTEGAKANGTKAGGEPGRGAAVTVSLERLQFIPPDRAGLPGLAAYASLMTPEGPRTTGYTEASRGCKHTCRHCPIVPVYGGRFRVVPREVVLEDVRRQVAAGARHITFGDPDFFNGPGHALPLVRALHAEFPDLTYDVTIKVEHLLRHAALLPELKATGCALVTSAVEALDDAILARFAKRHTLADVARAVGLLREAGLALNATFVAFTPWTSREVYRSFLGLVAELGLVESVSPVQYAIRLLVPAGSGLLELPELRQLAGPFDQRALAHPWRHPDPAMDRLQLAALRLAQGSVPRGETRQQFYRRLLTLVAEHLGAMPPVALEHLVPRPPIPYMSEPWYC
jgi:radical SAM superfamily enzyme YgiQ (UPF0313 family)